LSYRYRFFQSEFKEAFDGYSYIGQEDSLNQYATDMLHSFVLSDSNPVETFPVEFHDFLLNDWQEITARIRQYELEILKDIDNPILHDLYQDDAIGYMMSCNYYPKTKNLDFVAENNTRLSMHKDVSLLTIFPFGISEGLTYFCNNKSIALGAKDQLFTFPGYFMELVTNGTHTALGHQVSLPQNNESERYSFAIFSIPKPNASFKIGNQTLTGKAYYDQYLALF